MGYDEPRYHEKRTITFDAGYTGTAGSATSVFRMRCPKAMTLTGGTYCFSTGGTGAGRDFIIGKSLAGTGAVSTAAAVNLDTHADNASGAMTVTSTDFAAGDHLAVTVVGTAATGTLVMALEWVEDFG